MQGATKLSPTTLTFTPVEAERAYEAVRAESSLRTIRVTYSLGIVLSSAYFIFDYLALHRFEPVLLFVRLVVVNAMLCVGLATTFIPALKRQVPHIGAAAFLLHLIFFASINGIYDTPYVYTANGVITLGFLYLVWPLRFLTACAYGILGSIVYCGIITAARPWSAELLLLLLIFISMNCISIFAMYQTEYYRRSTYLTMQALDTERSRYHDLLTSILPKEVADRLQRGETVADLYEDVSVLFVDICNFTPISARFPPAAVLSWLNQVFTAFDRLVERHGLEKIKTIGDAYMVAGGFVPRDDDHVEAIAALALDMIHAAEAIPGPDGAAPQVRIGIHAGPVIAGVIGSRRFLYDLWGDTVNTASRMEAHGVPGAIQLTDAVCERLRHRYRFEQRGLVDIKGKGLMSTWLLVGRRQPDVPDSMDNAAGEALAKSG